MKIKKYILLLFLLISLIFGFFEYLTGYFDACIPSDCKSIHFKNIRKAIVIIPHQDDEIFAAGGLINQLSYHNVETEIVFLYDGNTFDNIEEIRKKEAIKSCKILGCLEENIKFLDFPNRLQKDTTNIPALKQSGEYYAIRDSLILSISTFQPDLIICSDFDFHKEHRVLTLAFDEAVNFLQQSKSLKNPLIMKGFAYQTAYYAQPDFFNINLLSTLKPENPQNKQYDTDIPQYEWILRLRIPQLQECVTHSLFDNKIYKAISQHKTQHVHHKALSTINSDIVFWERRTDNLLVKSKIKASSGDVSHLNDYRLYFADNVSFDYKYNVKFDNHLWRPDSFDLSPWIEVEMNDPTELARISLYDSPDLDCNITDIKITINDSLVLYTGNLNPSGSKTDVDMDTTLIVNKIRFDNMKTQKGIPGLSEIELFEKIQQEKKIDVFKIIDKENNNFIYKYFVKSKREKLDLDIYSTIDSIVRWQIVENKGSVNLDDGSLSFGDDFEYCVIKATSLSNPCFYDKVRIEYLSGIEQDMYDLIKGYEQLKLELIENVLAFRPIEILFITRSTFIVIKRRILGIWE